MALIRLDLNPYGGTNPLYVFPHFLKRTTNVLALRLGVGFRRLLRLGNNLLLAGERPL